MTRRPPDDYGLAGSAWQLGSSEQGLLAAWLLHAPKHHPYWHWWVMRMVRISQAKEAFHRRLYPAAEYEFDIYAIDPLACPDPDPDKEGYPEIIPWDIIEQFHGVTSEQATNICTTSVKAVLAGLLSPDERDQFRWKKALSVMVERVHVTGGSWPKNLST